MNYIKLLNGFQSYLFMNKMPTSAIVLWNMLVSLNNTSGWKEWFSAPNGTLQQLTGLSLEGIRKARNILLEHGLIEYENGKKGKAGHYKIVGFESEINEQNESENESLDEKAQKSMQQSCSKVVQNEESMQLSCHKVAQSEKESNFLAKKLNIPKLIIDDEEDDDDPHEFFRRNFDSESPYIQKSISRICEKMGNEVVLSAMKLSLKHGAKNFSYVEKVIDNWHRQKLTDVGEASANERQRKNKRTIPFPLASNDSSQRSTTRQMLEELRRGDWQNDS